MTGGLSRPVSFLITLKFGQHANVVIALKVHHAGFFESQEEYLSTDTSVPGMKSDIEMSDMAANGFAGNGVNGDHGRLPDDA